MANPGQGKPGKPGTTEVRRIPIKNIEGNWEEKISSTDNIFNLSIDLEFSMDNYRQRF